MLGGRWRGIQVEFQRGYGPKAVVEAWNAYVARKRLEVRGD